MQDRFKYRYWDKRINKMFYPERNDNFSYYVNNSDIIETMQCIGLKDKNGRLIYEGDIVKVWKFSKDLHGNDKRVIKWNDARCGFRLYTIDNYKRGIESCPQSMVNIITIEVIGNVYQHEYLLKEAS